MTTALSRAVDDCPYRRPVEDDDMAECNLLREVTGIRDGEMLPVERAACEACCDSFAPTPDDWNPIIASLLHQRADLVIQAGGIDRCDVSQAEKLSEAALLNLPVVLPDEDDGVDDVQSFVPPLSVSLADLRHVLPPPAMTRPAMTTHPSDGLKTVEASWAVGVTTAPRRQPTLSTCLDSLLASGWERPHLFVDGPVSIDDRFDDLERTSRAASIGAWPAWCAAMNGLLDTHPTATSLMIVQDDSLFPRISVLREYVESLLWPSEKPCIVSLYTSTDDMLAENVWRLLPDVWKYGAVVMIFPPDLARDLLESERRGELDFVKGSAGIDARIGVWADRNDVSVWHPSPSLIQHIGQVSSVWKRSRAVGLRRANRFIADEFLQAPE